ncbi:MAG: hypothetical protein M3436_18485 [Pseudomonadota bacterium]|nr:hypothetical protein [Pseudomonadota bacterium]
MRRADGSSVANYPAYVAQNRDYIDTLPFDGVSIHTPTGRTLMAGPLISYNAISNDWAPLRGVTWNRMRHNFAIVNVDRPADFFDDWTATIANYRTLARVLRETGIQGILFDNEDYQRSLWHYPRDVSYPGRSLQQYHDQARLRGRQVMEAVVSEFPNIDMLVLISPAWSFGQTPQQVEYWRGDNRLSGAFTVGMFEGRGGQATVIDGGEGAYGYRSVEDFQVSYDWRKYTIASPAVNCPFIPPATRPSWPEISISFGLYNGVFPRNIGLTMNPTIMRQIVERSLRRCDKYVWLYWETSGGNWYVPGSVPQAYVSAVVDGKAAAGSVPPPTNPLVSIDAVSTGRALTLGVAQVGATYYADRSYTITSLDEAMAGGVLVRTANEDTELASSPYLTLTAREAATVYVCYDNRSTTLPEWLRDGTWTATSLEFSGSDAGSSPMLVYSKVVPAGQFTLGGNLDGGSGAGSTYAVVMTPASSPFLVNIDAVSTGRALTLGVAESGAEYYADRAYTITSLDENLAGGVLVRTSNEDSELESSPYLTLSTNKAATVYICYDDRAITLPGWLRDGTWTETSLLFAGSDVPASPMRVYSKSVPPGQFTLGGNLEDGSGAGSTYAVVLKEAN